MHTGCSLPRWRCLRPSAPDPTPRCYGQPYPGLQAVSPPPDQLTSPRHSRPRSMHARCRDRLWAGVTVAGHVRTSSPPAVVMSSRISSVVTKPLGSASKSLNAWSSSTWWISSQHQHRHGAAQRLKETAWCCPEAVRVMPYRQPPRHHCHRRCLAKMRRGRCAQSIQAAALCVQAAGHCASQAVQRYLPPGSTAPRSSGWPRAAQHHGTPGAEGCRSRSGAQVRRSPPCHRVAAFVGPSSWQTPRARSAERTSHTVAPGAGGQGPGARGQGPGARGLKPPHTARARTRSPQRRFTVRGKAGRGGCSRRWAYFAVAIAVDGLDQVIQLLLRGLHAHDTHHHGELLVLDVPVAVAVCPHDIIGVGPRHSNRP